MKTGLLLLLCCLSMVLLLARRKLDKSDGDDEMEDWSNAADSTSVVRRAQFQSILGGSHHHLVVVVRRSTLPPRQVGCIRSRLSALGPDYISQEDNTILWVRGRKASNASVRSTQVMCVMFCCGNDCALAPLRAVRGTALQWRMPPCKVSVSEVAARDGVWVQSIQGRWFHKVRGNRVAESESGYSTWGTL